MKNAGWLFYRNYYQSLQTTDLQRIESFVRNGDLLLNGEKKDKVFFITESDEIIQFKWDNSQNDLFSIGNQQIELETTYPGLLIGTGYGHQTGSQGEFKLGFFFDHATGLPVIPGSSVKGLLRSAFPNREKRSGVKSMKEKFIIDLLGKIRPALAALPVILLENLIFDGKAGPNQYRPMKEHDVFHDACVLSTKNPDRRIFGEDYITPHTDGPLKNPKPVRFLKILSGVTLQFHFDLKNSTLDGQTVTITAAEKKQLFLGILSNLGIGAKTNVGYGQFK